MEDNFLTENQTKNKKHKVIDIILLVSIIVVVLFFFFVSQFWVSISVVKMSSMNNTLMENDKLLTDNLAKPKRGDIIVFSYDENSDFIKRVIAVEGQTIYNDKNGNVYLEYLDEKGNVVNELLNEPYVKDGLKTYKNLSDFFLDEEVSLFRVEVKKGELFVMGDNRLVSVDSRDFGVISISQVKGVVHQFWVDNKDIITKLF